MVVVISHRDANKSFTDGSYTSSRHAVDLMSNQKTKEDKKPFEFAFRPPDNLEIIVAVQVMTNRKSPSETYIPSEAYKSC